VERAGASIRRFCTGRSSSRLSCGLWNISDTLALSVETRGFTMDGKDYTVYRDVAIAPRDIVFAVILVVLSGLAVIL